MVHCVTLHFMMHSVKRDLLVMKVSNPYIAAALIGVIIAQRCMPVDAASHLT